MELSLNQLTYEQLKKDIMTFSLKPGEPVSAQKVAERYEVSRTPAREAMVRLQDEGMIDIFPQSKSVISKIKADRVMQEWYVRKSLELGLVDEFFDRVTGKDIRDMERELQRLEDIGREPRDHETAYDYLQADDAFHSVTYRAAGEHLASAIIANSLPNYRRVRLLIDLDNIYKDRTVSDHKRLIGFVKKQDREGYRAMLKEHLGNVIADMEELHSQYPDMFEQGD